MRRLFAAVLAACFGLPLLAAEPSAFFIKAKVMVYPFTATGSSVDREASSRLATLLAQGMANTGKVSVVPPPPGTERKDYLSVARAQSADYYVAGYISPLGNGVSLVEQVVSTTTGIVVYSQSAQINTYSEAAGQGDDLAAYIASHANRALAAIPTAPPQAASPTPAPSSGPEANLGKLFGRRKRAATPTPAPKPAASEPAAAVRNVTPAPAATAPATSRAVAVAPAPTVQYAVVALEGGADAALREHATARLASRLNAERAASHAAACSAHPVRAVFAGTLAVRSDAQSGGAGATVELHATDCSGKVLWHDSRSADADGPQGTQLAIERAVDAAIGAYLNPLRRRRR